MIGARAIKQNNSNNSGLCIYSNFEFESFTQMNGDFHLTAAAVVAAACRHDFYIFLCAKGNWIVLMMFRGLKHRLSKNWSKSKVETVEYGWRWQNIRRWNDLLLSLLLWKCYQNCHCDGGGGFIYTAAHTEFSHIETKLLLLR